MSLLAGSSLLATGALAAGLATALIGVLVTLVLFLAIMALFLTDSFSCILEDLVALLSTVFFSTTARLVALGGVNC